MMDSEFGDEHVRLLIHAIEGVNRTLELKSLLTKSMNSAKTLMKSEASSLMLVDELNGQLSVSIPTGPVGEEIKGSSIPEGKGIAGWVAKNQQAFLSNDPQQTEQFWKELSPNFKTRNILCVPLLNRDQDTLGVLQVLNKKDGEDYTKEDQQLFEVFASFVSTAIEKVREVDLLRRKIENRDDRIRKVHNELRDNLISINSYLQIDASGSAESKTRDILRSASTRVLTIANAHFLLKKGEQMDKIEMGEFINELFASVSAVFGDDKEIAVIIDMDKLYLNAEVAFTLGLMLNEVLVLLFRYAFQYEMRGKVYITGKKERDFIIIEISDTGSGLQLSPDEDQIDTDLSNVLMSLADSLDAELMAEENDISGTTLSIRFTPEND